MNPVYNENLKLIYQGIACENDKPISCYSGGPTGSVMMGMTVAEHLAEPAKGAKASLEMLRRIQDEAGPIHSINSDVSPMNGALSVSLMWCSRVLLPGKELPANSMWQIQEKKLVGPEAYDEILQMGYRNFVNQKILPQIVDFNYLAEAGKYAAEHGQEIAMMHMEFGAPMMMCSAPIAIPFEPLCGMRSMSQFYMDCYKRMDKLKEVSDFAFAEIMAETEEMLKGVKDDPYWIGTWVGGWRTASGMVNPKIWETLVWPYMKAAAELLLKYNKLPIFHLDQDWNRDIERFSELPAGKIVLNTDGMTDLPRARKLLPGYAIMGDVPPTLLTTGTPEQVYDYVTKLIDDVGPQGLFVCPGCDCPVNAKFENLVAMVKATNEWK